MQQRIISSKSYQEIEEAACLPKKLRVTQFHPPAKTHYKIQI